MLSLTRKAEYALIAVSHLARAGRQVTSARDVAAHYSMPLPLLMNILKALNRGGLVASVRGSHGGYTLARPADRISLSELVEAVEGPVRLVRCVGPLSPGETDCELMGCCPMREPVRRVHDRLRRFLAEVTVADIALDEKFVGLETPYTLTRAMAQ